MTLKCDLSQLKPKQFVMSIRSKQTVVENDLKKDNSRSRTGRSFYGIGLKPMATKHSVHQGPNLDSCTEIQEYPFQQIL